MNEKPPKFQGVSTQEREAVSEKERTELATKIRLNEQIKRRIDAARKGGRRLLLFNNNTSGVQ